MTVDVGECKPVVILLVEDNPVDVLLTKDALSDGRICNTVYVAEDGEEAMDFLHHKGVYTDKPLPDLILLDLNLPKKDGREVLVEIKQDANLRHIPVIVLTTSEDHEDVLRSYQLQANCFITKPVDIQQFTEALQSLGDFWFSVVKLPTK